MAKLMSLLAIAVSCNRPMKLDLNITEAELPDGKLNDEVMTRMCATTFSTPDKVDFKITEEGKRAQALFWAENNQIFELQVYVFHSQVVGV